MVAQVSVNKSFQYGKFNVLEVNVAWGITKNWQLSMTADCFIYRISRSKFFTFFLSCYGVMVSATKSTCQFWFTSTISSYSRVGFFNAHLSLVSCWLKDPKPYQFHSRNEFFCFIIKFNTFFGVSTSFMWVAGVFFSNIIHKWRNSLFDYCDRFDMLTSKFMI